MNAYYEQIAQWLSELFYIIKHTCIFFQAIRFTHWSLSVESWWDMFVWLYKEGQVSYLKVKFGGVSAGLYQYSPSTGHILFVCPLCHSRLLCSVTWSGATTSNVDASITAKVVQWSVHLSCKVLNPHIWRKCVMSTQRLVGCDNLQRDSDGGKKTPTRTQTCHPNLSLAKLPFGCPTCRSINLISTPTRSGLCAQSSSGHFIYSIYSLAKKHCGVAMCTTR